MRCKQTALSLFLIASPSIFADYQNLIATEDGRSVYFQAPTGISSTGWFVTQALTGGTATRTLTGSVADVNGTGTVTAYAFYAQRQCGIYGSSCFVHPDTISGFSIEGDGIAISRSYGAMVRLDRNGSVAWIDSGATSVPNGLVDLKSQQQIAPTGGTKLANQRIGRRALADGGRALVFAGIQMNWLDRTGLRPIRHTASVFEAVTDRTGTNIVYSEADGGTLHWITGDQDESLGFIGSTPALTSDGTILVFIDANSTLQAYNRQTKTVKPLSGTVDQFTLAGMTVFASDAKRQLIQIDLVSGIQSVVLLPSPQIQAFYADTAPATYTCGTYCYGTPEPGYQLTPGMIVSVKGSHLNSSDLVATINGLHTPVLALSDSAAYFQVPTGVSTTSFLGEDLTITGSTAPITFKTRVFTNFSSFLCFGTWHQDFTRQVSKTDPALVGEAIHVFLTGLHGSESVPDNMPNPTDHLVPVVSPPGLFDPNFADVLFFGLAPGQIGLEQLDLRVKATPYPSDSLFRPGGFGCSAIPVTALQQ